jgi:plasmid stabilization system protein ParE
MVEIIWTITAIDDLNNIGDYIAKDSLLFAKITIEKLFKKSEILSRFPNIGRVVPEKNNESIRELIEGNYRIIYQKISDKEINILTIIHSSRILEI